LSGKIEDADIFDIIRVSFRVVSQWQPMNEVLMGNE
jgi:hypothetical protein